MRPRLFTVLAVACLLLVQVGSGLAQSKPVPRVIVVGVNGMEWDLIRPLIMKGDMPNLAKVIAQGTYGKLQTLSAPIAPRYIPRSRPVHRRKRTASQGSA